MGRPSASAAAMLRHWCCLLAASGALADHGDSLDAGQVAAWIRAAGGAVHPDLVVPNPFDHRPYVGGVHAFEPIAEGEVLLLVPSSLILQAEGENRQCALVERVLAENALGNTSRHWPHLRLMDGQEIMIPNLWGPGELELLRDLPMAEDTNHAGDWVRHLTWYRSICGGDVGSAAAARAALLVVTRATACPSKAGEEGAGVCLIPFFDLVQHRRDSANVRALSTVDGFELRAARRIEEGEPLYVSITGSSEALFRDYGIIEQLPQEWRLGHTSSGNLSFVIEDEYGTVSWPAGEQQMDFGAFVLEAVALLRRLRSTPDTSPSSACPPTVVVAGAERLQGSRMGVFTIAADVEPTEQQEGRPIYKNADGQYLYYWKDMLDWKIGDTYHDASAGVSSFSDDAAPCPSGAWNWAAWDNSQWSEDNDITITVPCPARVRVSGVEHLQPMRMGIFSMADVETEYSHDRRPVYVNEEGEYLFYWSAVRDWKIGASHLDLRAGVSSFGDDEAWCPTGATDWAAWDDSGWSFATPIAVDEPCPEAVDVTGAEALQSARMGRFSKTSLPPAGEQAGRPIYKNKEGQYLYYWASVQDWKIGSSYAQIAGGVSSFGDDGAHCPTEASAWKVWDGLAENWTVVPALAVRVGCPPLVEVAGAQEVQPASMGIFRVAADAVPASGTEGRPIYVNAQGEHLYYKASTGSWEISSSPAAELAGLASVPGEAAACPTTASRWHAWDGRSEVWSEEIRVTVRAPMDAEAWARRAHQDSAAYRQERHTSQYAHRAAAREAALAYRRAYTHAVQLAARAALERIPRRERRKLGFDNPYEDYYDSSYGGGGDHDLEL